MMRLFTFLGSVIGSWIGWTLSDYLGGSILVSFIVSSLFAIIGVYFGWKIGGSIDS